MKFTDKSFIKNRLIPGIVFLLVTLIVLTLVILFNNPNILSVDNTFKTIIKILCFAVFAAFGGFIFYEFISSFHLKKIESIFLAILMLITLIFPFHYFMIGIVHNISSNDMEFIKMENVAFVVVTDYYSILIWVFTSLCFFVMKIFSVDNPDYRSILLKSFIFLAVSYLLMISSKILIYSVYSEYQYFILFVVVSFVTDTGGYIGGSLFGGKIIKKKLAPKISPKKTWEGAIVGFVLSAIVISILIYSLGLFQLHDTTKLTAKIIQNFFRILLVILLPIAAIIGDLIFSCIKRLNNIKDFSKILRGHGGFLDRFDSLSLITFVGFTILLLI